MTDDNSPPPPSSRSLPWRHIFTARREEAARIREAAPGLPGEAPSRPLIQDSPADGAPEVRRSINAGLGDIGSFRGELPQHLDGEPPHEPVPSLSHRKPQEPGFFDLDYNGAEAKKSDSSHQLWPASCTRPKCTSLASVAGDSADFVVLASQRRIRKSSPSLALHSRDGRHHDGSARSTSQLHSNHAKGEVVPALARASIPVGPQGTVQRDDGPSTKATPRVPEQKRAAVARGDSKHREAPLNLASTSTRRTSAGAKDQERIAGRNGRGLTIDISFAKSTTVGREGHILKSITANVERIVGRLLQGRSEDRQPLSPFVNETAVIQPGRQESVVVAVKTTDYPKREGQLELEFASKSANVSPQCLPSATLSNVPTTLVEDGTTVDVNLEETITTRHQAQQPSSLEHLMVGPTQIMPMEPIPEELSQMDHLQKEKMGKEAVSDLAAKAAAPFRRQKKPEESSAESVHQKSLPSSTEKLVKQKKRLKPHLAQQQATASQIYDANAKGHTSSTKSVRKGSSSSVEELSPGKKPDMDSAAVISEGSMKQLPPDINKKAKSEAELEKYMLTTGLKTATSKGSAKVQQEQAARKESKVKSLHLNRPPEASNDNRTPKVQHDLISSTLATYIKAASQEGVEEKPIKIDWKDFRYSPPDADRSSEASPERKKSKPVGELKKSIKDSKVSATETKRPCRAGEHNAESKQSDEVEKSMLSTHLEGSTLQKAKRKYYATATAKVSRVSEKYKASQADKNVRKEGDELVMLSVDFQKSMPVGDIKEKPTVSGSKPKNLFPETGEQLRSGPLTGEDETSDALTTDTLPKNAVSSVEISRSAAPHTGKGTTEAGAVDKMTPVKQATSIRGLDVEACKRPPRTPSLQEQASPKPPAQNNDNRHLDQVAKREEQRYRHDVSAKDSEHEMKLAKERKHSPMSAGQEGDYKRESQKTSAGARSPNLNVSERGVVEVFQAVKASTEKQEPSHDAAGASYPGDLQQAKKSQGDAMSVNSAHRDPSEPAKTNLASMHSDVKGSNDKKIKKREKLHKQIKDKRAKGSKDRSKTHSESPILTPEPFGKKADKTENEKENPKEALEGSKASSKVSVREKKQRRKDKSAGKQADAKEIQSETGEPTAEPAPKGKPKRSADTPSRARVPSKVDSDIGPRQQISSLSVRQARERSLQRKEKSTLDEHDLDDFLGSFELAMDPYKAIVGPESQKKFGAERVTEKEKKGKERKTKERDLKTQSRETKLLSSTLSASAVVGNLGLSDQQTVHQARGEKIKRHDLKTESRVSKSSAAGEDRSTAGDGLPTDQMQKTSMTKQEIIAQAKLKRAEERAKRSERKRSKSQDSKGKKHRSKSKDKKRHRRKHGKRQRRKKGRRGGRVGYQGNTHCKYVSCALSFCLVIGAALVLLFLVRALAATTSTTIPSTPTGPTRTTGVTPSETTGVTESPGPFFFCQSEACRREGRYIASLLSPDSKPCDNLYSYVCDAWSQRNPIDSRGTGFVVSRDTEIQDTLAYELRPIIQNAGDEDLKDAAALLSSCRARPEPQSLTPLVSYVFSNWVIGRWPLGTARSAQANDVWKFAAELVRDLGVGVLLEVTVGVSPTAVPRESIVELGRPRFLLDASEESISEVQTLIQGAIEEAFTVVSVHDSENIARQIEGLLVELSKLPSASPPRPDDIPDEWVSVPLEKLNAGVQFFVRQVFEHIISLDGKADVLLKSPAYIQDEIANFVQRRDPHTVLNYMGFVVLVRLAPFFSGTLTYLRYLFARSMLGYTGLDVSDTPALCMLTVESLLPNCFAKAASLLRGRGEKSVAFRELISRLETMFGNRIKHLAWIGELSALFVRYRMRERRVIYFGPHAESCAPPKDGINTSIPLLHYLQLSMSQQQRKLQRVLNYTSALIHLAFDSDLDTEARYDAARMAVHVPAAILNVSVSTNVQLFAFQAARVATRLYRALVRIVTEEPYGGQLVYRLTENSTQGLESRLRCVGSDLGRVSSSFRDSSASEQKRLRKATLEQAAAIHLAFEAFRELLHVHRIWGLDFRMETLPQTSSDQLFFIYLALDNCHTADAVYRRRQDIATSGEYRVNFPLRHLREFSEAFSCHRNPVCDIVSR